MENLSSRWGTEQLGNEWINQGWDTEQQRIQDLQVKKGTQKHQAP